MKKSILNLTKSARFHKLSNCPIWDCPDFAPGVIQLCLFAGTAVARGANDHLVLAPIYPCPGPRPIPSPRPSTVVDPPVVLFKYADYTGTFSPIFAQHRRCWFCILVDDCLDFGRENHNFLKVYRLLCFIYHKNVSIFLLFSKN